VLATGGWDRSVHFWDLRSKTSINKLFGYYIGGEAIDFKNDEVMLGNNSPEHQLRIYDMKADKIRPIHWDLTSEKQAHYTTGVLGCFFGYSLCDVGMGVASLLVLPKVK
jgi:WD40 repeat protein